MAVRGGCSKVKAVVIFQFLSHVQVFAAPWTAAHQASLSITISWSLLKLLSIELVMPFNHLILCHPLLLLPSVFPASGSSPIAIFQPDENSSPIRTILLAACMSAKFLQVYPTPCNPMDCSTPGFPVHHQLPELTPTHVHRVGDAIELSHPLSSPSPLAFNVSQH